MVRYMLATVMLYNDTTIEVISLYLIYLTFSEDGKVLLNYIMHIQI